MELRAEDPCQQGSCYTCNLHHRSPAALRSHFDSVKHGRNSRKLLRRGKAARRDPVGGARGWAFQTAIARAEHAEERLHAATARGVKPADERAWRAAFETRTQEAAQAEMAMIRETARPDVGPRPRTPQANAFARGLGAASDRDKGPGGGGIGLLLGMAELNGEFVDGAMTRGAGAEEEASEGAQVDRPIEGGSDDGRSVADARRFTRSDIERYRARIGLRGGRVRARDV